MSDTQVSSDTAEASARATVPLRLEVSVLPVSDVDRAKAFYLLQEITQRLPGRE